MGVKKQKKSCLRASPTCVEDTVLDCERLHPEAECKDVEVAVDAAVLLFVAHVGAAERRLPQAQVVAALIKRHTLKKINEHYC